MRRLDVTRRGLASGGAAVGLSLAAACGSSVASSTGSGGAATTAAQTSGAPAPTAVVSTAGPGGGMGGQPGAGGGFGGFGGQAGSGGAGGQNAAGGSGGQGLGGGHGGGGQGGGAAACTPAQKAMRWAAMVAEPITLPGQAAGLALQPGLTLAQARQIDCAGTDLGDQFGDGSRVEQWGQNGEVWLDYLPATTDGAFLTLWPGYTGALAFKGGNGQDAYSLAVGAQISKNAAPFELPVGWSTNDPAFVQAIDALARGLTATFTNQALDAAGTTCLQSQKCTTGTFPMQGMATLGYVFFKPVGFGIWVNDVAAAQPGPSTPDRIDLYRTK